MKLEQNTDEEPKFCLDLLPLFQADVWKGQSHFEDHETESNTGSSLSEMVFSVACLQPAFKQNLQLAQ